MEYLLERLHELEKKRYPHSGYVQDHIIRVRAMYELEQDVCPNNVGALLAAQWFRQGYLKLRFPGRIYTRSGFNLVKRLQLLRT